MGGAAWRVDFGWAAVTAAVPARVGPRPWWPRPCGAAQKTPEPGLHAPLHDNGGMNSSAQARNPLHGITLERIVTELSEYYGWPGLGDRIPLRCFNLDPSVTSSLRFLRKTPWAREKVESLYLFMLREQRRHGER